MNLRQGERERGEGPSMILSPRSRLRLFIGAQVPAISQIFSPQHLAGTLQLGTRWTTQEHPFPTTPTWRH